MIRQTHISLCSSFDNEINIKLINFTRLIFLEMISDKQVCDSSGIDDEVEEDMEIIIDSSEQIINNKPLELTADERNNHLLSFQNLTFKVQTKTFGCNKNGSESDRFKTILDQISGEVKSGQMVSVMGPSGAGKTSLLKVLCLRSTYGKSYGSLTLDGARLDGNLFKAKCFFVGQYDNNWTDLTVHETCSYAARLFGIHNDTTSVVNNVIDDLGLTGVAQSRNSSLSGGQRRRLSLAVALLKQPAVLFLDEVTSGLDSASADNVCYTLRKIATEKNVMIICTIHQPSTKIFLEYFDSLILLSIGRIAYFGGTRNSLDYFASLGYPVPESTNPSEHYLELANSDFGTSEDTTEILNAWENRMREDIYDGAESLEERKLQDNTKSKSKNMNMVQQSLLQETLILFRRHFFMTVRDPILYVGRSIIALIANCVISFVYWNARMYTQDQMLSKLFLIGWLCSIPMLLGAVAVFILHDEFNMIKTEQQNGMLRFGSYVIVKNIFSLPFIVIYTLSALVIPGFVIQGYPPASWLEVFLLFGSTVYLFESLAEALAVWMKDKSLGMLIYLSFWILSFLFGGLFLPEKDLLVPLKPFYHITPFSNLFRSMCYKLYSNKSFDSCDSHKNPYEAICVESGAGSEILEKVNVIYPLFKNEDTFLVDISVILGMALVYKAIFILGIFIRSREISVPRPDTSDKSKGMILWLMKAFTTFIIISSILVALIFIGIYFEI